MAAPLLFGETAPSAASPGVKHTTSLKFQNGRYSSIFGIVPKEYTIESQESREIVQRLESESAFTLQLLSSDTRRILSLEGETPTIESGSKPLTGKVVRADKHADGWKPRIEGLESPTEEETREAVRLVGRFAPGTFPFSDLVWSADGTAPVDAAKLLTFLGYTQVREVHGKATVTRAGARGSDAAAEAMTVEVEADFVAGEENARITVNLKASGPLQLTAAGDALQSLGLEGKLALHGHRKLEDGRVVPYNLISDFSYQTTAAVAPAS